MFVEGGKTVTKPDVFSLESLIAWLETMPVDKEYNYCRKSTCLIAQYLQARGVSKYELDSHEIDALGWMEVVNPRINYIPTFGAALSRARSALEKDGV